MLLLYLLLLPLLLILVNTTQAEQGSAAWHGLAMFITYIKTSSHMTESIMCLVECSRDLFFSDHTRGSVINTRERARQN